MALDVGVEVTLTLYSQDEDDIVMYEKRGLTRGDAIEQVVQDLLGPAGAIVLAVIEDRGASVAENQD
jgi:hypothetical protein